jgi:hypothetical protein
MNTDNRDSPGRSWNHEHESRKGTFPSAFIRVHPRRKVFPSRQPQAAYFRASRGAVKRRAALDARSLSRRGAGGPGRALNAKDDRAQTLPVTLAFVPREPGAPVQWTFVYRVRFAGKVQPVSISVETENRKLSMR